MSYGSGSKADGSLVNAGVLWVLAIYSGTPGDSRSGGLPYFPSQLHTADRGALKRGFQAEREKCGVAYAY